MFIAVSLLVVNVFADLEGFLMLKEWILYLDQLSVIVTFIAVSLLVVNMFADLDGF